MTSPKPARGRLGVALLLLVAAVLIYLAVLWILRSAGDRLAAGHAVLLLVAVVIGATGAGLLVRRWHR